MLLVLVCLHASCCAVFCGVLSGIDDGKDINPLFLGDIYDRITTNEIRMKDSNPTGTSGGADIKRSASSLGTNAASAAIGQTGESGTGASQNGSLSSEPHSDSSLGGSSDRSVDGVGGGRLFYLSSDADVSVIQPMFDLLWFPALATFSMILEESEDAVWVDLCLGMTHAPLTAQNRSLLSSRVPLCCRWLTAVRASLWCL